MSINNWYAHIKRKCRKDRKSVIEDYKGETLSLIYSCPTTPTTTESLPMLKQVNPQQVNVTTSQPQPEPLQHSKDKNGIDEHGKTIESLKERFDILAEAYKQKCIETDTLNSEITAMQKNGEAYKIDYNKAVIELNECTAKLEKANRSLHEFQTQKEYKNMKRALRYQKKKFQKLVEKESRDLKDKLAREAKLKLDVAELKSQIVSLRKKMSSFKIQVDM